MWEGHECRDALFRRGEVIDDRAVGWKEIARIAQTLIVRRGVVARETVIAGRVVILHLVTQGANQRHLVHDLGSTWQKFADRNAGKSSGDWLELAADTVDGIGLHIERVVVARPAPLVK